MKKQILGLDSNLRFFLYQVPVSMRGGIERLKGVVINDLSMDPANGDVYIFISRNHKTIKLLHYENNVFTLYVRRIYKGQFVYPIYHAESNTYSMSWERLRRLVKGYGNSI